MALYGLLDLLIMPREVPAEVLALRYGLMVLPLTAALALSFHPRLRPYQQSMSAAAAMLCGVAVVTMLTLSCLRGVAIPYEGILLVMMYIYGCGGLRFGLAVASCSAICVAYPLASAWAGLEDHELIVRTQFIVTTNVIGIANAWVLDQEARRTIENTRQLHGMAHRDFLTGLLSRRAFAERMDVLWRQAIRERRPLSVALIDVDCFNRYNDHKGHLAGDEALRRLAGVLARHAQRPMDLAARNGGEEFVCVWYDTPLAAAAPILAAIHADVARLEIPHETSTVASRRLSLSIGACEVLQTPGSRLADAIRRADLALYEAKAGGRDRTAISGPGC